MKGVRILVHAVRQVAGSPIMALRVSALPLALVAGVIALLWSVLARTLTGSSGGSADVSFSTVLLGVLMFVLFAWVMIGWIAVRWHRYVLLEEGQSGWIPPWNGRLVVNYVLTSLLIGLIVGVGAVVATTVPMMVAGSDGPWLALIPLIVQLVAIWIVLRLSISLPASAPGGGMRLGEAWARTKPAAGATAVPTGLLFGLNLVRNALLSVAALAGLPIALAGIVSVPFDWALMMVSLAVLTTLHGHLVEGRPLG